MTNYNFDENDKTVDIPDFIEDKDSTESTSVDMSIFKMTDDELYDDVPKSEIKKESRAPKKKSNATLVLSVILIGILLVTSIVSIMYALKEHKKVSTLNNELTQVKTQNDELKTTVQALNAQVEDLNKKIEEAKNSGGTSDKKYPSGAKLKITEAGNAQGLKVKASMDSDWVENSDGTKKCLYYGDEVTLIADAVKDTKGNYWGQVENGFMRIEYDNGEDDKIWAEIVE